MRIIPILVVFALCTSPLSADERAAPEETIAIPASVARAQLTILLESRALIEKLMEVNRYNEERARQCMARFDRGVNIYE